jgi:hypothetical protein
MPRIRPTPPDVRRRYRDQLPPGQRRAFDRLARLIDAPEGNLSWHHAVGGLVGLLRPEKSHGSGWARGLARALGPSDGLLSRCRRFRRLYPEPEDLERFKALGVSWTPVWLTLAVPDRETRHKLLRLAVAGRRADRPLRLAAQQRSPSNRRGVEGRRPKAFPAQRPGMSDARRTSGTPGKGHVAAG